MATGGPGPPVPSVQDHRQEIFSVLKLWISEKGRFLHIPDDFPLIHKNYLVSHLARKARFRRRALTLPAD